MKSKFLKIQIAGSVLLATGLANAATVVDPPLLTYSVISGAAVNIAAQPQLTENPNVGGHLAAQAAVTIGANTTVNDIYAGAAVTTGDGSKVKQIHAGAAASVGANAFAQDVNAGAAVTIGANGAVGDIKAGAAITLGAGATYSSLDSSTITHGAGSRPNTTNDNYIDDGYINSPQDMAETLDYIDLKLKDQTYQYNPMIAELHTDLSGLGIGSYGGETTVHYSAINLQANTTLHIEGKLTVITSEAMTMGAGATIKLGDNATVTWILGGSLNLGADSDFNGVAYVRGSVNGATSDVGAGADSCANIYALGAVSIRSIGQQCDNASITALLGKYENLSFCGETKNDYHYVTLTKIDHETIKWTNRANVSWTLRTTDDKNTLVVIGSPYAEYADVAHSTATVTYDLNGVVTSITGPDDEPYGRVSAFSNGACEDNEGTAQESSEGPPPGAENEEVETSDLTNIAP
jgi:hypothetical protein